MPAFRKQRKKASCNSISLLKENKTRLSLQTDSFFFKNNTPGLRVKIM